MFQPDLLKGKRILTPAAARFLGRSMALATSSSAPT